jgi:signal recognition particle receptor subunit beta
MARDSGIQDVYIAVMGITGAGKSTFIATSSEKSVKVGHDLRSCKLFENPFDLRVHSK